MQLMLILTGLARTTEYGGNIIALNFDVKMIYPFMNFMYKWDAEKLYKLHLFLNTRT